MLCVSKCIYHAFASGPYTALTISAISRGGVKLKSTYHVTRLKLIFELDPLLKYGSRAPDKSRQYIAYVAEPMTSLRLELSVSHRHEGTDEQ